MAEEKRDVRSAEEAKGAQEEPQQGKPWTLVELWGSHAGTGWSCS